MVANPKQIIAKYSDRVSAKYRTKKEIQKLEQIIAKYKKLPGNKLLDMGCGTGNLITFLKDNYYVSGLDSDKASLDLAKEKHPDVKFYHKSILSFKVKNRFDIITCLGNVVSFMNGYSDFKKAVEVYSDHLNSGGIVLLEPFSSKNSYETGQWETNLEKIDDVDVVASYVTKKKGDKAIIDYHFLISDKTGVKHIVQKNTLMLYDVAKVKKIMNDAGFKTTYLKSGITKGNGLFIGVRI